MSRRWCFPWDLRRDGVGFYRGLLCSSVKSAFWLGYKGEKRRMEPRGKRDRERYLGYAGDICRDYQRTRLPTAQSLTGAPRLSHLPAISGLGASAEVFGCSFMIDSVKGSPHQ